MSEVKNDVLEGLNVRSLLTLLLLTSFLTWYITFLWSRRYLYIYSWKVSGPFALPFIGCSYLFLRKNPDILDIVQELTKQHSKVIKLWLGHKLLYVVYEPDYIEKVLTSPHTSTKGLGYEIVHEVIGESLIIAKDWKLHRKAMAPSFNQKVLDSYVKVFVEDSENFLEMIKGLDGKKDCNWKQLITKMILDSTCKNTMGVEAPIRSKTTGDGDFAVCIQKIMSISTYRFFRPWFRIKQLWALSQTKKEFDYFNEEFHKLTMSMVSRKLNQIRSSTKESGTVPSRKLGFLDAILEESKLTDLQITSNVKAMFVAATDTTRVGLSAVFIMLGMWPDVQQKVYEEVMDVVGADRQIEASDLPHLKYTERVIKEALRLFCPVLAFARSVTEDLDLGELILPKGATVAVIPIAVQRNSTYWKDPLKFDPDRFLPEEVEKRHPCTMVLFSYGSRNCIGHQYGIMNLKAVISVIIKELKVFTDYKKVEDIKLNPEIIISFKEGLKIWFEARK